MTGIVTTGTLRRGIDQRRGLDRSRSGAAAAPRLPMRVVVAP